jgi:protease secretion system outer membrane protein
MMACTPAAFAQSTTPEAGINAVPLPAAPPPVVTTPQPATIPLPQTTEGGRVASFPTADPPPPPNVPPELPLAGTVPANRSIIPGAAATSSPVAPVGPVPQKGRRTTQEAIAAGGVDILSAYELGQRNDATYRAALAEHDANREIANQTIAGYLPTAGYNYQNIPTESGARHVITVTQPVVSLSGVATLRQRAPRRRYAEATLQVRAQDLATRLITAVTDIIKANEATTLNDVKIDSLKQQSDRADRLYKRGLGTVTDARDIEVRYEQSLANRALLKSDQIAAAARMRSITGSLPPEKAYLLPAQLGPIELSSVDAYLARQEQDNPTLAAARETEHISKLESDRIRGSFLPTVGVSATYTRYQGQNQSYVGLSVNAPLNGGTFFQASQAAATVRRSYEERRQTEEKARTELQRLHALVDGGYQALLISAKAIESAKLSVEANTKSYEGGVRTSVDVVNAIQTQFEVQNAYVQSATTLAQNYLNLLLLAGEDPEDALLAVQKFLLAR